MRAALPNRQTGAASHDFRGCGWLDEARNTLKSTPGHVTPPCSGQDLVKIPGLRVATPTFAGHRVVGPMAAPAVEGVRADPELGAEISNLGAGLVLLEGHDDLLVGEAVLSMSVLLLQEDRRNCWIRIRG